MKAACIWVLVCTYAYICSPFRSVIPALKTPDCGLYVRPHRNFKCGSKTALQNTSLYRRRQFICIRQTFCHITITHIYSRYPCAGSTRHLVGDCIGLPRRSLCIGIAVRRNGEPIVHGQSTTGLQLSLLRPARVVESCPRAQTE